MGMNGLEIQPSSYKPVVLGRHGPIREKRGKCRPYTIHRKADELASESLKPHKGIYKEDASLHSNVEQSFCSA